MERSTLVLLGIVAAIILAAGGGVYVITRGMRNNNPLSIRRSGDKWIGLQPVQTDPEFFQFVDPVYSFRAGARILRNYRDRYGIDTLRKIANRWSPPSENPTAEIVSHFSQKMRLGPDTPFDLEARLPELLSLIALQENGVQPYPPELIVRAVNMA